MATQQQVEHYQGLAEEAARMFNVDTTREISPARRAWIERSYKSMSAKLAAMPAPAPAPRYKPTFCYDFDDTFEHVVLDDFLRIHASDELLCAWARTAQLGERRSGVQRVL